MSPSPRSPSVSPSLALQSPDYRAMWIGSFISNIGTWVERVAVGIYVAESTGRSGWSGLAAAALFLPSLVMAPVGGALADCFERRSYLLVITLLQLLVGSLLAVLSFRGALAIPVLLAILVATGCTSTMMWPAFNAFLTEVVPEEALGSALYLSSGQFNLARVMGPLPPF